MEIYQGGKFRLNGTPYCSGHPFWLSDSKIKQNITNVTNALTTINQLNPVKFDFKVTDFSYLNLSSKPQIGFISQDVQSVLPYLVDSVNYAAILDSNGIIIRPASTFLSLGMSGIIPIAIKGIQELDSIVTNLSSSTVKKSCSLNVNYLTKSTGTGTVCNSQMYDNGVGIGIGTTNLPVGYKFVVEGKAGFLDLIVKSASLTWPDYVFDGKHSLKPIEEVENFVTTNKHLPGIPSQDEIEKAGGINVGEIQTKQMEKIEELYLYIIEMNKNMQEISLENQELKERMKTLENK